MPKSGIKKEKEMRTISNQKYEITDMAHEEYPFLHRIRALRDICGEICAGDIGGFVEAKATCPRSRETARGSSMTPLQRVTPMWIGMPVCGATPLPVAAPMFPKAA